MVRFDTKPQGPQNANAARGTNAACRWACAAARFASSCTARTSAVRMRPRQNLTPEGVRAGTEGGVMLRNVRTLHSLIGVGILAAFGGLPLACGDDQFTGCEANRTCPSSGKGGDAGAGGEAGGGTETGGSAGSSTGGGSGSSGSSGAGEGGAGDGATG